MEKNANNTKVNVSGGSYQQGGRNTQHVHEKSSRKTIMHWKVLGVGCFKEFFNKIIQFLINVLIISQQLVYNFIIRIFFFKHKVQKTIRLSPKCNRHFLSL